MTKIPKQEIIRLLKLAQVPSLRIGELCREAGISPSTLRRWRRLYREEARWTDEDLILAALHHNKGSSTLDGLIDMIDWMNHSRYKPEELKNRLRSLARQAWVEKRQGAWHLTRKWP